MCNFSAFFSNFYFVQGGGAAHTMAKVGNLVDLILVLNYNAVENCECQHYL